MTTEEKIKEILQEVWDLMEIESREWVVDEAVVELNNLFSHAIQEATIFNEKYP